MRVLICPMSQAGYLYPAIAVGRQLVADGDRVWVLGQPGACRTIEAAGLDALPVAEFGGNRAFNVGRWFQDGADQYAATLRAARAVDADALLTSVLCFGSLLAARTLGLPVVVLGFAAHVWNYAPGSPTEPDDDTGRAWRTAGALGHIADLRARLGLPTPRDPSADLVGDALLLRGPVSMEYPGAVLPERVRHIGPCTWEPPADADEVADLAQRLRDVGKPVVYVHLGRFFGGTSLWPRLNAAFTGAKLQAVVEQGRSGPPELTDGTDLLVVRKPWLAPLVELADLVLTCGTSTPVLGALVGGRPLVVAPAGSEQPVLAQACVRLGLAARLPVDPADCARALTDAWSDESLRHTAATTAATLTDSAPTAAAVLHHTTTSHTRITTSHTRTTPASTGHTHPPHVTECDIGPLGADECHIRSHVAPEHRASRR